MAKGNYITGTDTEVGKTYCDVKLLNPIRFSEPIAPHIAAAKNNYALNVKKLMQSCENILQSEGALRRL